MSWRSDIEAQIARLRKEIIPQDEAANTMQALLDVAVAADNTLLRKHMRGEIYAGHTVDKLETALDKLRETVDE